MFRADQDDFVIAMAAASALGNERRDRAQERRRTAAGVNELVAAHRAALRRIAQLEGELARERAARLAAEINAERRH